MRSLILQALLDEAEQRSQRVQAHAQRERVAGSKAALAFGSDLSPAAEALRRGPLLSGAVTPRRPIPPQPGLGPATGTFKLGR